MTPVSRLRSIVGTRQIDLFQRSRIELGLRLLERRKKRSEDALIVGMRIVCIVQWKKILEAIHPPLERQFQNGVSFGLFAGL
jgi:hypothetical protein